MHQRADASTWYAIEPWRRYVESWIAWSWQHRTVLERPARHQSACWTRHRTWRHRCRQSAVAELESDHHCYATRSNQRPVMHGSDCPGWCQHTADDDDRERSRRRWQCLCGPIRFLEFERNTSFLIHQLNQRCRYWL